jgi:hypothetical protein
MPILVGLQLICNKASRLQNYGPKGLAQNQAIDAPFASRVPPVHDATRRFAIHPDFVEKRA